MEEKSKTGKGAEAQQPQPKKLSYEELNKAASDLHVQYQKLLAEYRKAMEALNNREFDYMSFFLQTLFKVMEHPEMYKQTFVDWAASNIEEILTNFADGMKTPEKEEEANEAE